MDQLNEAIQRKIRYESALKTAPNMPAKTLKRWREKLKQAEADINTYERDISKNKEVQCTDYL